MAVLKPHYSKDEFARRGQTLYERDICPHLTAGDHGKLSRLTLRQAPMR